MDSPYDDPEIDRAELYEQEVQDVEPWHRPTPGPWFSERETGGTFTVYGLDDRFIADVWMQADALVIAAAPDLLAAVKAILAADDHKDLDALVAALPAARAAVAKAEGR